MSGRLLTATIVLFIAGCVTGYSTKLVQHHPGSIFYASETGYYTAELVMDPDIPVVGANEAKLIIHNYDAKDMTGMVVKVRPYFPGKGIVPDDLPVVIDEGSGIYRIRNIVITEPGQWVLIIEISGGDISDRVTPILPEVR